MYYMKRHMKISQCTITFNTYQTDLPMSDYLSLSLTHTHTLSLSFSLFVFLSLPRILVQWMIAQQVQDIQQKLHYMLFESLKCKYRPKFAKKFTYVQYHTRKVRLLNTHTQIDTHTQIGTHTHTHINTDAHKYPQITAFPVKFRYVVQF